MSTPVLEARDVSMVFGGLKALKGVTLTLEEGKIVGLIGPNGAGKTTFFNCLTGLYTPTTGEVLLKGNVLPGDPAKVTDAGVARTFQNIRLFPSMTVLENVMVGRHVRMKQGPLASLFHGPAYHRGENAARERSRELLAFVGLNNLDDELSRNLPYGDQRRLEIARALATDPAVLLLDEPTAGMNPQETEATQQLIFRIRETGVSVVVIEHDIKFIFGLCDSVSVLVQGELLVEGSPEVVRADPRVVEAYLGKPPEEVEHEIEAVRDISFTVEAGQIVSLIGSNGAGKTTTLRTISGLLRPTSGSIKFQGKEIHNDPAHAILGEGIAHCPEGRRLFPRMTVEENLQLGAYVRKDDGVEADMQRVYDLFPVLGERRHNKAGLFSGGEQQMLAIGRAMMSKPRLLMLDEPSMGLSPIMTQKIFDTIKELQSLGTTILLVEQNALAALALSDHGYVIDLGKTTLDGPGRSLLVDPQVRDAYLGEAH